MAVVTGYVNGVPSQIAIEPIDPAGSVYLEHNTAVAFRAMREAAKADGIDLHANSGWRSYQTQERLYRQWQEGKRKLRPSKPGWSNHQSGVAVDIQRDDGGDDPSPVDVWLRDHASEYGFINDVPGEPWHWHYIPGNCP